MNFYWKDEDVDKIKEFYYCSGATSASTRTMIFTALIPKFNVLIGNCINATISAFSNSDKQEVKQQLLIHIWEVLSNRLNPEKIQGVQNYLWLACRNYLHEIYRRKTSVKAIPITYTYDESLLEFFGNVDENEITLLTEVEIHQKILKGLDIITPKFRKSKINQLAIKVIELLKQYLIENQFTQIEHFKDYCIKELNITNRQFILVTNKLRITSMIFKPKNTEKYLRKPKKEYNAEIGKIMREKYKKKKKVIDEFY